MVRTTERSLGLCDPLYNPKPPLKPAGFQLPRDELLIARKAQLAQKDWRANEQEIESAKGWPLMCTHENNTPPNEAADPVPVGFKRFARFDNKETYADVRKYRHREVFEGKPITQEAMQLRHIRRNEAVLQAVNANGHKGVGN